MRETDGVSLHNLDEDAALRTILEGTATATGPKFSLKHLAEYEHDIDNTPCEAVLVQRRLVHFPDSLRTLYPDEPDVSKLGVVSYMGVPLLDLNGEILGHLAVMDRRPMPEEPRSLAVFQIFAARAAAELQRMPNIRLIVRQPRKGLRIVATGGAQRNPWKRFCLPNLPRRGRGIAAKSRSRPSRNFAIHESSQYSERLSRLANTTYMNSLALPLNLCHNGCSLLRQQAGGQRNETKKRVASDDTPLDRSPGVEYHHRRLSTPYLVGSVVLETGKRVRITTGENEK